MNTIEEQISDWRTHVRRRQALQGPAVEELESRLRAEVTALTENGLAPDEAFLIAVKRLGSLDALSREFALKLLTTPEAANRSTGSNREFFVVLGLAVGAAIAIKLPSLFGMRLDGNEQFYARNISLFVFPLLAIYFLWKRGAGISSGLWLALPFAAGAVVANIFKFLPHSDTEVLNILHLPIALWLAVGFAYVRPRWFARDGRMNFVRYTGELVIYYALIALGGGVFTGFTMMMFFAIGIKADWLAAEWIIPCGAMGAVIVGSWLVEAKQSVIENMAPVLTRLFTPLFTILLLVFLATMAWTGNPIGVGREVLIGFDLLLVLIVGLVLYSASARDTQSPPNFFDRLQLLLVLGALVVDALALAAIAGRISEFGFTPNRVAALGENIILLVNLAWSAWLYARFLLRRGSFADLERWQIQYLPVYFAWAALVVVLFPPLFGYR